MIVNRSSDTYSSSPLESSRWQSCTPFEVRSSHWFVLINEMWAEVCHICHISFPLLGRIWKHMVRWNLVNLAPERLGSAGLPHSLTMSTWAGNAPWVSQATEILELQVTATQSSMFWLLYQVKVLLEKIGWHNVLYQILRGWISLYVIWNVKMLKVEEFVESKFKWY